MQTVSAPDIVHVFSHVEKRRALGRRAEFTITAIVICIRSVCPSLTVSPFLSLSHSAHLWRFTKYHGIRLNASRSVSVLLFCVSRRTSRTPSCVVFIRSSTRAFFFKTVARSTEGSVFFRTVKIQLELEKEKRSRDGNHRSDISPLSHVT